MNKNKVEIGEFEYGKKKLRIQKYPDTWYLIRGLGPFLESPGNFTGPKSNIQIEI